MYVPLLHNLGTLGKHYMEYMKGIILLHTIPYSHEHNPFYWSQYRVNESKSLVSL